MRLRRSALYLPAANARAIEKSKTLLADSIILDLEDSVAAGAKAEARVTLAEGLASGGFGSSELVVRVNPMETEWAKDDLEAFAKSSVDAICLPKVETVEQIQNCISLLDSSGGGDKYLWIMVETPRGLANVEQLVLESDRLQVLMMGTSDLGKELRIPATPERDGFQYALQRCLNAARMAGLDAIDGVYGNLDDAVGYESQCVQGRNLGYDGKSLIHPKQIGVANTVFAPSLDEVNSAQKIVNAWAECEQQNLGVTLVNGKLVEELHVLEAKRIVELQDLIDSAGS